MSTTAPPRVSLRKMLDPSPVDSTGTRADELARRPVRPRVRTGQVLATASVIVLIAWIVDGLAANPNLQWGRFGYWFHARVIVSALWVTLEVTGWSALFGLVLGVLLAVARLSNNSLWRGVSWLYIWFFRSIPLVLLLIVMYNIGYFFPRIGLGIPFGPILVSAKSTDLLSSSMLLAVIGLVLNEAAFAAELIRGGILSVDHGQIEAANALGLSRARQLRRVILPQALRSIVPGYVNQMVGLIKASSLVYYVSLIDLFGQVYVLESRFPTDVVPLLLAGAAWYLILTAVLSVIQYYLERYFARGALRTLPLTPWQKLRVSTRSALTLAHDIRSRVAERSAA